MITAIVATETSRIKMHRTTPPAKRTKYTTHPNASGVGSSKSLGFFQQPIAFSPKNNTNFKTILPNSHLSFIKSDGPDISGIEQYQAHKSEQFILLAPYSFTSIEVACVMNQNTSQPLRLIFLGSNDNALIFWNLIRLFFIAHDSANNLDELERLVIGQKNLFLNSNQQDGHTEQLLFIHLKYIIKIIEQYEYKYIRRIIINATYYKHDWTNPAIFQKILDNTHPDRRNFYVYAANIVSKSQENEAKLILDNIEILKPKLSIHSNQGIFMDSPTKILFFKNTITPPEILQTLSNEISYIGYDSPHSTTLYHRISNKFQELEIKLDDIFIENEYQFDKIFVPFLIDVIFKMAGIMNIKIENYSYDQSFHQSNIIFHLPESVINMGEIMEVLNERFPLLNARFPLMGEAKTHPLFPTRIALDMDGIITTILPQIAKFLIDNPSIKNAYTDRGIILTRMTRLFSEYGMHTGETDCFENTLCLLVSNKMKESNPSANDIVSTSSMFGPFANLPGYTIISLTTPLTEAIHIVDYFNSIDQYASELRPEQEYSKIKKLFFTQILVKNEALLSEKFIEDIRMTISRPLTNDAINSYPESNACNNNSEIDTARFCRC